MSFWKSLFGGSDKAEGPAAAKAGAPESYNGFTIRAAPFKNGTRFQAAGHIEKEVGGELKVHYFIRADYFSSAEEAERFSLNKARQIVDLMGESVFEESR